MEINEDKPIEVKENKPKLRKKKIKVEVFTVDQFCGINAVSALDKYVANKKFASSDRKTIREWEELFENEGIPYKR
jgi:hypothetical protein